MSRPNAVGAASYHQSSLSTHPTDLPPTQEHHNVRNIILYFFLMPAVRRLFFFLSRPTPLKGSSRRLPCQNIGQLDCCWSRGLDFHHPHQGYKIPFATLPPVTFKLIGFESYFLGFEEGNLNLRLNMVKEALEEAPATLKISQPPFCSDQTHTRLPCDSQPVFPESVCHHRSLQDGNSKKLYPQFTVTTG